MALYTVTMGDLAQSLAFLYNIDFKLHAHMIHYCDYRYKTISRPSVCYEEEKYCCDGYTLENNMCVCKFIISSSYILSIF